MTETKTIRKAEFNPKVCKYWLISGVLVHLSTIVLIPLLIIWFPLALILTKKYLARMECVLTAKALKVKKGVLVRIEKTIPLDNITDMGLVQGPIMRAMGLHKLTVETAGQTVQGGALVSLTGIVDAEDFREAVLNQRDAIEDQSAVSAPAPETTPSDSTAILSEIRDSLLRIEDRLAAS